MSTRTIITGLGTVLITGGLIWVLGFSRSPAQSGPELTKQSAPPKEKALSARPLLAQAPVRQGPARQLQRDPNKSADFVEDTFVIPNCHLSVDEKTEVSTQREGVLLFVGRPIEGDEQVPPGHLDTYSFGGKTQKYRRLKEGDIVEVNDVLGRIDDRLARDELETKKNKLKAANADLVVSQKTLAEAKERLKTQADLLKTRATSMEEYRGALLAVDKYVGEVESKKAAIEVAKAEQQQTQTVVEFHEIRSKIRGQVKAIYKRKGEEVKNLEPILLLRNLDVMRAEGRIDTHRLPRLTKGMKVWVEPSEDQPHHAAFFGHLEPITGVAVANDSRTIVSVSDDRTARVWERGGTRELRIFHHPVGVRSVACTPKGAATNYCATGGADGSIRLYDLAADSDRPLQEFQGKHRGPVACIAFNKDGTICATGGDDHDIRIWDVATGQLKFKLTDHHGQITSLQFTPQDQLVSAARDNTLMLWNMSAGPPVQIFRRRSGAVSVLGVSPDGKRILYDPAESKALRVLSLPEGLHEGIIRNASGPGSFSTLALFSPDGRFILAGEGSEGRLELWTAPKENSHAAEIRKLAMDDPSTVTCAAFAPDASFVVAGTKDRQVLAWGPLPSEKDVADFRIPAVIANIDRAVDPGNRPQVRIVAEFENPKGPDGVGKLLHGGTVNLVIPPAK